MTAQRTINAAVKRIREARKVTYDGYLYEDGRNPRKDEWVNGVRAKDWDLVIAPFLESL